MSSLTVHLMTLAGAYLIGSIPSGYLAARARGIDIRSVGSGNIGATNVFRVLGKVWGTLVLTADVLKGAAAVVAVKLLGWDQSVSVLLPLWAAIAVVLGHNYTCWLGFKGGKGIATSAGALLALMPIVCGIVLFVFLVVFKLSGYVSLGSILAAAILPVATGMLYKDHAGLFIPYFIFSFILGTVAIWRHKANIQRLRDGTENRFGKKKTT